MNRTTGTAIAAGKSVQLKTEVIRKAIHILVALVPLIAAVDIHFTIGLLAGGTLFYILAENARRRGRSIILVSDLTLIASRGRDNGKFVLGPVTLGVGAMLALLLYPEPASVIAIFALAFGLYTYVNPVPTVTGGPNLVKLLTEDCKEVTGGQLNVETDPVKAVDEILASIESKRKKLGI